MQIKIRAILAYVEWYRRRYKIAIGSQCGDGQDLGTCAQMIENLARDEFGHGFWIDLANEKERDLLYAYVVNHVAWFQEHGTMVEGWDQLAWQTTPETV